MFDYYRFRFSILRGWNPELGYELMVPIGLFGVVLILVLGYLTGLEFDIKIAQAPVTQPVGIAFGLVALLAFMAYLADDLKRPGLWLIIVTCVVGLGGVVAYTIHLSKAQAYSIYANQSGDHYSPSAIGATFAAYLVIVIALTVSRLRGASNS